MQEPYTNTNQPINPSTSHYTKDTWHRKVPELFSENEQYHKPVQAETQSVQQSSQGRIFNEANSYKSN